jgi:hypothetical protein
MPNVMLMRTYSVVVLAGTAVMLSKNTGTAGDSAPNAVAAGFRVPPGLLGSSCFEA